MKIAVTATEPSLDALIDPRFGRCRCFVIANTETPEHEIVDNSNTDAPGGAGISTAQMIVDKKVEVVITGNCGPNAYKVLSGAKVKIITGVTGKVSDAINDYKKGSLSFSEESNVAEHFGAS